MRRSAEAAGAAVEARTMEAKSLPGRRNLDGLTRTSRQLVWLLGKLDRLWLGPSGQLRRKSGRAGPNSETKPVVTAGSEDQGGVDAHPIARQWAMSGSVEGLLSVATPSQRRFAAKIAAHEIKERRARRCGLPRPPTAAQSRRQHAQFTTTAVSSPDRRSGVAAIEPRGRSDRALESEGKRMSGRHRPKDPSHAVMQTREKQTVDQWLLLMEALQPRAPATNVPACHSAWGERGERGESGVEWSGEWNAGVGSWTSDKEKCTSARWLAGRLLRPKVAICCACDGSKFVWAHGGSAWVDALDCVPALYC
ncbi:hypothetical protein K505DRAFT_343521 [Melanomma pulvis-pyrius CBS 109.77]|uniref:Uncharacterized protein n=1 Tax=Melanomma pulvis-pyrius CBS 109.77 TaxID=1314802 RepID=A0A6A6WRQ3_9PLEO|nr:hypothetical protein K505DRAFT_343521 [Melanomma pulvis-pyrius CBS 109.77]